MQFRQCSRLLTSVAPRFPGPAPNTHRHTLPAGKMPTVAQLPRPSSGSIFPNCRTQTMNDGVDWRFGQSHACPLICLGSASELQMPKFRRSEVFVKPRLYLMACAVSVAATGCSRDDGLAAFATRIRDGASAQAARAEERDALRPPANDYRPGVPPRVTTPEAPPVPGAEPKPAQAPGPPIIFYMPPPPPQEAAPVQ